MNDWYDGTIEKQYPIPCYREAIKQLPDDIASYSSAADDINRALQMAIAHEKDPSKPLPTITTSGPGVGQTTTTAKGRKTETGPIQSVIDNSSPGGATSFPLPLIILGGLAIFLLALGAVGLVIRRMQDRGDSGGPPATP